MDSRGLYNLQKQNDWCAIEDLVLFASLTSDTGTTLPPRLQSHFAVIQLPDLRDHTLKRVTSEMLHSFLPTDVHPDTVQGVLGASIEAYTAIKQVLKVSDMPGRQHYFFSLGELESVFQVCKPVCQPHILRLIPSQFLVSFPVCNQSPFFGLIPFCTHSHSACTQFHSHSIPSLIPSLYSHSFFLQGMCHTLDPLGGRGKGVAFGWCHEVKRVFMEGLCRMSDLEWIEGRINALRNKVRMSTYFGVSTRCLACVLEFKGQSLQSLKKKKCD